MTLEKKESPKKKEKTPAKAKASKKEGDKSSEEKKKKEKKETKELTISKVGLKRRFEMTNESSNKFWEIEKVVLTQLF